MEGRTSRPYSRIHLLSPSKLESHSSPVPSSRSPGSGLSNQKGASAPQKQPIPKTARSYPSGNGGSKFVPSTACVVVASMQTAYRRCHPERRGRDGPTRTVPLREGRAAACSLGCACSRPIRGGLRCSPGDCESTRRLDRCPFGGQGLDLSVGVPSHPGADTGRCRSVHDQQSLAGAATIRHSAQAECVRSSRRTAHVSGHPRRPRCLLVQLHTASRGRDPWRPARRSRRHRRDRHGRV